MAVVKKPRRSAHSKSFRQQQQQQTPIQQQQSQQQQQQSKFQNVPRVGPILQLNNSLFESNRLKAEPSTSIVHDESDTISFRQYILKNFIESSKLMTVLTTSLVPNDKIIPTPLYFTDGVISTGIDNENKASLVSQLEQKLNSEIIELNQLKRQEETEELIISEDQENQFFKDKLLQLNNNNSNNMELNDKILKEYTDKFKLRSQENTMVIYKDEFSSSLRQDTREAPTNYWDDYFAIKKKLATMAAESQRRQTELQKNLQLEQQEELKRTQDELQKQQQNQQQQQQQQQQQMHQQQQSQQQQQQQQQQQPNQTNSAKEQSGTATALIDNMFDDFNSTENSTSNTGNSNSNGKSSSDQFNTNFDDDFGDLDNVFF
ncbi:Snf6p NDAI_0H00310 [Naumovozyma dairenensis CBS 421]|uniref:Uncharacterized protein n=1 Tax=Naumovozyma dairenensis (strain ATCC 10597 / BCRC 20456 / CBS 421 / NBRC 0211 / NRRL Y-12639) TaxID=1071378 RepID=G0WEJ4_NAUDC|nr:hypothetical protein NDAI_0H00310 [Naumovozyma dairenensis CBS 421]CCD26205.1 hypothetical protein NDAI_0H00310 [Naumovozyma dairenensis CBS 421]